MDWQIRNTTTDTEWVTSRSVLKASRPEYAPDGRGAGQARCSHNSTHGSSVLARAYIRRGGSPPRQSICKLLNYKMLACRIRQEGDQTLGEWESSLYRKVRARSCPFLPAPTSANATTGPASFFPVLSSVMHKRGGFYIADVKEIWV